MNYENTIKKFVDISKRFIESSKLVIFEIGARDCAETLGFNELLPNSVIYSFECNPATIEICRNRVKPYINIHLIEKAVSNIDGVIKFYPIDQEKTVTTWPDGNPGASSAFKSSGKYPVEEYVQKEIEVESITLHTFMNFRKIPHIDLLWMDIQGSELNALQGLNEKLNDVKLIHLEVEFFEIYKDQPLFHHIKKFLNENGFYLIGFTSFSQYSADAVFVNKHVVKNIKDRIPLLFNDAIGYYIEKISKN